MRTTALRIAVVTLLLVAAACRTPMMSALPDIPSDLTIRSSQAPESLEGLNRWVAHFWERRALFREENAALEPDEECVVLLGDSLTEGWRLEDRTEQFLPEGYHYMNRGITSDHVLGDDLGILRRMDESVFDCQPSHIFFLMGANDLGRTARTGGEPTPERVFGGYHLAVNAMRERCPDAVVCVVTTSPVGGNYEGMTPYILEYNDLIRSLAAEENLPLIDLFALLADENNAMPESLSRDGLHFNDEGFRRYGEAIAEVLEESR